MAAVMIQKSARGFLERVNGIDFAHNRIRVPQRAVTYAGVVEDIVGHHISVEDALGTHFDYSVIMSAELDASVWTERRKK